MPDTPATLTDAMIAVQASLPAITRNEEAQIGTRTYRYADLASIHALILPLLASCGLYWTCRPTMADGQFMLAYTLTHTDGDSISGHYPLPASGSSQAIGSAIIYARRYTLCAVLGIAPDADDDDGAAAAHTDTRPSYTDRVAAGRMDRAQATEHGKLRDLDHPRPAERLTPDDLRQEVDPWGSTPYTGDPEHEPGSITQQQIIRISERYKAKGITDRAERLESARQLLGLTELASSKDLSMAQASDLIRRLQGDE
jgi:hypothetical protein